MLSESRIKVVTEKVGRLFAPTDEQYPHYRLVPIETDRQGYLCLLFYIDRNNFLVLEPHIKRYAAVRRLSLLLENAPYTVYETVR